MDSLKTFSVATKDGHDDCCSFCSRRTEVVANYPGESIKAGCDTRNATTLMTLPIEIRSATLRQVLGDRHVHTHFDRDYQADPDCPLQQPRFTFCCDQFYEDMDRMLKQENLGEENPERYSTERSYLQRHYHCFEGEECSMDMKDRVEEIRSSYQMLCREYNMTKIPFDELHASFDPDEFDARLSVLTVCRQLRHEGLRALYSSNTFTFVDSYSFNAFMKQITAEKISLVRKLELSLNFQCDNIDDDEVFEYDEPQKITSNWTVGGPGTRYENMWAALDGLADVTIWACDKVPIHCRPRSEWNKGREARLKRIRLWLRWIFGDLRDLRKIRKTKVLVSWKSENEGLATREQIHFEADQRELQSVGDNFAREILGTTPNRHTA